MGEQLDLSSLFSLLLSLSLSASPPLCLFALPTYYIYELVAGCDGTVFFLPALVWLLVFLGRGVWKLSGWGGEGWAGGLGILGLRAEIRESMPGVAFIGVVG